MPIHETTTVGAPVWIELTSSDLAGAREFYSRLFDWTAEVSDSTFNNYVTLSRKGQPVAGMVAKGTGSDQRDAWMTFLLVDDAESTSEDVLVAGGQVFLNDRVADLGTMLVFADPSGTILGGWVKGTHRGFTLGREAGTPVWNELHTRDFPAAVAFFEKAFGWTTSEMSDSPEFRMATFGEGDDAVAGIFEASDSLGAEETGRWVTYFGVDDTDAATALIVELGGALDGEISDTPFGRMVYAVDPLGARFAIIEMPAES